MPFFGKKAVSALLLSFFAVLFITACGGGGNSGSDNQETVTPSAPSNLTASNGIYSDRVLLTWSAVVHAQTYKIYRSPSVDGSYEVLSTITSTTYDDTTVSYRTPYFYKVSSVSSGGTESQLSTVETGYSDHMPGGILGLEASNGTHTDRVMITWNSDGNSNSYEVLRSASHEGPYTLLGEPNLNAFEDDTSTPGKNYFYKVRGKSEYGTPGEYSGFDNGYASLASPASVTASEGSSNGHISLSWSPVPHASTYTVYRSETSDGTYSSIQSIAATAYNDASAAVVDNPGKSFFYRVAGVSQDTLEGFHSTHKEGWIAINRPSNLTATSGLHYTCVKLNWTGVSGAVSYKVYRDGTHIATPSSLAYSDTSAVEGQTYTYAVTSLLNGRESDKSDTAAGSLRNAANPVSVNVTWNANREKSVNRTGGGYRVYYSKTPGFDISGASYKAVPYDSGPSAPTSTSVSFDASHVGTWYLKVVAYSDMSGLRQSEPSSESVITIE